MVVDPDAAHQGQPNGRCQSEGMEERQSCRKAIPIPQGDDLGSREDIGNQIRVCELDSLGFSGGTRGEKNGGRLRGA